MKLNNFLLAYIGIGFILGLFIAIPIFFILPDKSYFSEWDTRNGLTRNESRHYQGHYTYYQKEFKDVRTLKEQESVLSGLSSFSVLCGVVGAATGGLFYLTFKRKKLLLK